MHSSRMRTARLLPVSPSMHCSGGGTWSWGVPGLEGCTWSRGVYLVLGGVPGPWGCTWSLGVYLVPGGVPGLGVYLVSGGVPGLGGVPGPRGVCTWSWGVYLIWGVYLVPGGVPGPGGTCPGTSPPVNRMANRCKNITLPQT